MQKNSIDGFKLPASTKFAVRYVKTKSDGTEIVLAIVTEHMVTHQFCLYIPDESGTFKRKATSTLPEFEEVESLYK